MRDSFDFRREKILRSAVPWDFTNETSILGFEIGGTEPTDSRRKFLFESDNKLYKFEGDNLIEVDCSKSVDDVLTFGNSTAELLSISSIPEWCGKFVTPIIAMDWAADSPVLPTVNFGVKVKSYSDIFAKSEYSPVFELGSNSKFVKINFTPEVSGGATANLQVRLRQDNTWSNWMNETDAQGQICQAVQLRANYTVTSLSGSSTAKIADAEIFYTKFADENSSFTSTLYLKPESFSDDLATCYVLVNHSLLVDCNLKAFVSYSDLPTFTAQVLGFGTNSVQTFELEDGIDFDTFLLKVDDIPFYNFTLNAADKTVSLTAPQGKRIDVSYYFNIAPENWQEMELQYTEYDDNFETGQWISRFVFRLDTVENSKLAKVKVVADISHGTEEFSVTSTGSPQLIPLHHFANPTSISVNSDYYFDQETNILGIDAPADTEVNVSYDWQGLPVEIYRVAAAHNV